MVTRIWVGAAAALSALGLVVACSSSSSSSSGGTGPGAVSSVDSSKKAADLSEADAQQYCRDALAYQKSQINEVDSKRYTCAAIGAVIASFSAKTDEEAKAACIKSRDECIAKPSSSEGDAGAEKDPCANAKKDLGNCTATVAEINQCTADQVDAYKAVVNQDPCASATAAKPDGGQSSGATLAEPASCKALKEKCPALYGDDDSGGGGGGDAG
jgi:hypothetical protein